MARPAVQIPLKQFEALQNRLRERKANPPSYSVKETVLRLLPDLEETILLGFSYSDICEDFKAIGIAISPDTLKTYLQQAKKSKKKTESPDRQPQPPVSEVEENKREAADPEPEIITEVNSQPVPPAEAEQPQATELMVVAEESVSVASPEAEPTATESSEYDWGSANRDPKSQFISQRNKL